MRAGSFQFHRNQTRLLGFTDQNAFLGHPFAPLDHEKLPPATNCRNSSISPHPNKTTKSAPPAAASDLALSSAPSEYGALEKSQYNLFVQFFRQATPYIEGHRGRTFVLVLPGEIVDQKGILHRLLEDIALLHSLGIKLVIVVGARSQIEAAIKASGGESTIVSGMRVTDQVALEAAVEAAGRARMEVEARLSKGPTVSAVRRHVRGGQGQQRYDRGIQTVTGNYVAAKRKGVVNGVDYQYTGAVRFVQTDAIKRQLDAGAIVLLNNLGYSAAGEVLNCNIYDVALGAAADLMADKLIIPTLPETLPPGLPAWLPLRDAENYLQMSGNSSSIENGSSDSNVSSNGSHSAEMFKKAIAEADGGESSSGSESTAEIDMDKWYGEGVSLPLVAACLACQTGVKRAHLVSRYARYI
jgi:amino-acid N-acetyltransferase